VLSDAQARGAQGLFEWRQGLGGGSESVTLHNGDENAHMTATSNRTGNRQRELALTLQDGAQKRAPR
jgi:hypothetical protein